MAAIALTLARRARHLALLLFFSLKLGDRLLQVLKRKLQLIGIELLALPAEAGALKLPHQMLQPLDPALQPVALGDHFDLG